MSTNQQLYFRYMFGYAEIHYSFLPGLSLISKKQPEIITDAPVRITPGQEIPLLLIIKDSHIYPIDIISVEITVFEKNAKLIYKKVLEDNIFRIEKPLFSRIYNLPAYNYEDKTVTINTKIEFRSGKNIYTVLNDNLPTLSHGQLEVRISSEKMPAPENYFYGDIHVHTSYSTSHVEFGAPIKDTAKMAKAMGLSWIVTADHSYDLMCSEDNFLSMDSNIPLWKKQQEDIKKIPNDNFVILNGEEVSCGNKKGQNVHLLSIGNKEFIKGSGDGARRKLNKKPELSVSEAVKQVNEQNGVCFAAHPKCSLGWLHKLALNRGQWSDDNFLSGIKGLQFWNGLRDKGFFVGRKKWKELLLKGHKLNIVAGSDAHGDFNRLRRLKTPFLSLTEDKNLYLGNARTCIYLPSLSKENLINNLQNGKYIVTDGPFMDIELKGDSLLCTARSTKEFGKLINMKIYGGIEDKEVIIKEIKWEENKECFAFEKTFTVNTKVKYFRGELSSLADKKYLFCMTNPVWVEH